MKKKYILFAGFFTLLCFLVLISIPVNAQKKTEVSTEARNGLLTTSFNTPQGAVSVFLPSDMAAGDVISGTVVAEPTGKNPKQMKKNSNVISGYVVEVEEKEEDKKNNANIKDGVFKWIIPTAVTEGIRLILKDKNGKKVAVADVPVLDEPPVSHIPEIIGAHDFGLPDIIESGVPTEIVGPFDSDLGSTNIQINDNPVTVLAESPRKAIFVSPDNIVGLTDIKLTENDVVVEGNVNCFNLGMTADKLTLQKGENTDIHIEVSGLEGIYEDIPLEITNLTPNVVNLSDGNNQVINISPDDISGDGTFSTDLTVSSFKAGSFSVSANLNTPDPISINRIYPEAEINYPTPEFMWSAYNIPPEATYAFRLWQVAAFETPDELADFEFSGNELANTEPYFEEGKLNATTFAYPENTEFPLEPGHVYAWQVTATVNDMQVFTSPVFDVLFANLNTLSGYKHISSGAFATKYYPRGYKHITSGDDKSKVYNPGTHRHITSGDYKTKIYPYGTHNHITSGDDKSKIYPRTHKHIGSGKDRSSIYNPSSEVHIKYGENASHVYPKTHNHINSGEDNTKIYPKTDKHINYGNNKTVIVPSGHKHIAGGDDNSKIYPDGDKHITTGNDKTKIIPEGQKHITVGNDKSKTYSENDTHIRYGDNASKVIPEGQKHITSGTDKSNTYPEDQKHITSGNNKSKIYDPEKNKHLTSGNDKSKLVPQGHEHVDYGSIKTQYRPKGSKHITEGNDKTKLHTREGKIVDPEKPKDEAKKPNDPKKPAESKHPEKEAEKSDKSAEKAKKANEEPGEPESPKSKEEWENERNS